MASAPPRKHHALAIPVPAQGHMNPLMRFCKKLARQGFTITFVNIDPIHYRIAEMEKLEEEEELEGEHEGKFIKVVEDEGGHGKLDIRRAHVPIEGLDLSQGFSLSLEHLLEAQKSIGTHLEKLLVKLNGDGAPVTCLISDMFISTPTQDVADKFNIPRIVLYPSSLSFQLLNHYIVEGTVSLNDVLEAAMLESLEARSSVFVEGLQGLPTIISKKDVPHFRHVVDDTAYMYTFIKREVLKSYNKAHSIAFNSFEDLEGPSFKTLSALVNIPIYGVGPLFEPLEDESSTTFWKEDISCMAWLDQQPPLSVLYVSFGSVTLLSHPQFEEILAGLLASQHRFLWVFRPGLVENAPQSLDPVELASRTHGKGYFVDWAPQSQVLSHPSVGGFLTHCGWNSTIEAIAHGVPMLCWPYFADQSLDAKYVLEEWKNGLGFSTKDDSGLIEKDEVKRVVQALMEGEEGKILRKHATQFKEASCQTILPGGTSYKNLQALIKSLPSSY